MLRKDDLVVVRCAGSSRVPEFVQRVPRKMSCRSADASKVLAIAPENNRLHMICQHVTRSGHSFYYRTANLSGKIATSQKLPVNIPTSLTADGYSSFNPSSLTCPADLPILLKDAKGVVFPFIPPSKSGSHETWTNPSFIDLPPLQCAAFSWLRTGGNGATDSQFGAAAGCGAGGASSRLVARASSGPRCLLGLVIINDLRLMPHVLRANDSQVERLVSSQ